ncbi:septum formation initiator [Dactylosporangium sp. NPDC051485]|uniref:septum formation initiator n=1 Tax=Dactylosporangium sp. NPDC051485 TaxID=3154846 RepID=UPI003435D019
MRMRWPLAVLAWLAAAALATAASIGAVNTVRQGLFGASDQARSESEVEAEVAPFATPSAAPSAEPGAPPPSVAAATRAMSTGGGSLVASCADGQATLVSWIPRAGFEADHVVRGPAPTASLRFKARSGGGQYRAQVTCVSGEPALSVGGDDD